MKLTNRKLACAQYMCLWKVTFKKIPSSGGMGDSLGTIEDRIQDPFICIEEEPWPSGLSVSVAENSASSGPARTLRNLPCRISSMLQRAGITRSVSNYRDY